MAKHTHFAERTVRYGGIGAARRLLCKAGRERPFELDIRDAFKYIRLSCDVVERMETP